MSRSIRDRSDLRRVIKQSPKVFSGLYYDHVEQASYSGTSAINVDFDVPLHDYNIAYYLAFLYLYSYPTGFAYSYLAYNGNTVFPYHGCRLMSFPQHSRLVGPFYKDTPLVAHLFMHDCGSNAINYSIGFWKLSI